MKNTLILSWWTLLSTIVVVMGISFIFFRNSKIVRLLNGILVIGLILFITGGIFFKGDKTKLFVETYVYDGRFVKIKDKIVETKVYDVKNEKLNLIFDDVIVKIRKSKDNNIRIKYDENTYKHKINNNTLSFGGVSSGYFEFHLGGLFNHRFEEIILELPENKCKNINIKSVDSEMEFINYNMNELNIDMVDSDFIYKNINIKNMNIKSRESYGYIRLDRKIASDKLRFNNDALDESLSSNNKFVLEDKGIKISIDCDEESSIEIK